MPNPAFIQGNTTTTGSGQTSATCAFSSNVTAGSLLYCTVRVSSAGPVTNITCTDNNGNTWTATAPLFTGGDNWRSFYVVPANAGATTVTVTIIGGGTGFIRFAISESGPGITGVTDTAGNTWKFAFAFANPGNVGSNFDTVFGFFVPKCLAGANTVTIHTTDANAIFWNFAIIEYSGLGGSPVVIASNYAAGVSGVSGSSGVTGNLHARQGGIMAAIFGNPTTNGLTVTPGTGWTSRQTMNGNTIVMDSLASGAGIFQAPCGFSSAVPWEGAMVLLGTAIPVIPIVPQGGGSGFGPGGSGQPGPFNFKFGF